jgi:hypothetical protein
MQLKKSLFFGLCFCLFAGSTALAQIESYEKTKGFNITIIEDGTDIKMKCVVGCAWVALSFKVPRKGQMMTIDQFGMVGEPKTAKNPDDLAVFSIGLAKVRGEFTLTGLEGVNWETLKFKLADDKSNATVTAGGVRVR